jgi:hypothetical protein
LGILHFDATGRQESLEFGRTNTLELMASHLTHTGVHDHGFNNISTYGNLLRLVSEGRLEGQPWQRRYYELALKVSGAVQASRWTELPGDRGYIYSFNGTHSLFIDTIRTLRSLAVSHRLGHVLFGEQDRRISLLSRLLQHGVTTSEFAVYHGRDRDAFDVPGRVAHEAIFNVASGEFRCPSTQQGYSAFTTWTRGLAWAILGFAEQLEFLLSVPASEFEGIRAGGLEGRDSLLSVFRTAAEETADFYLENTPVDGIPYWDTGAPGLTAMPGYLEKPADPYNEHEPVDSSAASIAAQGLLRLGRCLTRQCGPEESGAGVRRDEEAGKRYRQAGLTITRSLFQEPYLSLDSGHEGLILHSVYHRPNGWDYVPEGSKVPCGESCLWGDYHALELAVLIKRITERGYLTFFDGTVDGSG